MIKLIAADMDGTLLDSRKRLSPRLIPAIRALKARGVKFAVASGRQYYNLLTYFGPVRDDIAFISENGALIRDGEDGVDVDELEAGRLAEPLEAARSLPDAYPVLCGAGGAYIEDDDPDFVSNVEMYYARRERVPDLLAAAKGDKICKIAVYEKGRAETGCYPLLRRFEDSMQVCLSGASWVDLLSPTANKGAAVQKLKRRYGAGDDECMVFGDYLNDYEMMQTCRYSYAMANAHPKLKEVSRYEAKSNDEDGVMDVLSRFFGLEL